MRVFCHSDEVHLQGDDREICPQKFEWAARQQSFIDGQPGKSFSDGSKQQRRWQQGNRQQRRGWQQGSKVVNSSGDDGSNAANSSGDDGSKAARWSAAVVTARVWSVNGSAKGWQKKSGCLFCWGGPAWTIQQIASVQEECLFSPFSLLLYPFFHLCRRHFFRLLTSYLVQKVGPPFRVSPRIWTFDPFLAGLHLQIPPGGMHGMFSALIAFCVTTSCQVERVVQGIWTFGPLTGMSGNGNFSGHAIAGFHLPCAF